MDNEQNKATTPENDNWLDEILGQPNIPKELGPDELAVQAAGLTHPDDLELEKILAEDWDSVPDLPQGETVPLAEAVSPEELPTVEVAVQEATAEVPEQDIPVTETIAAEPEADTDAPVQPEATADAPVQPEATATEAPVAENDADKTQFFAPVVEPAAVRIASSAPDFLMIDSEDAPKKAAPGGRKTRPAPKKGYGLFGLPHIFSTVIWLFIILAIGVTLGRTLWVSCADLMAFGKPDHQVTITITEDDTIETIAQKLGDANLIEYPKLFEMFATLTGKDADIDVGTFTLNSKLDYNAMINNMINYGPAREQVEIMIPEGYNCAQIFALLEERGVCTVAQLEEYAANGELGDYWFLEDVERGDKYCLEGFLFPDTYKFYTNDEPRNALRKFLDGFDYRFTDVMREKLDTIKERTGLDLSIREVVTIASMVERETASNAESYKISAVIFNRLRNSADFPYLNIDATLIYALGGNIDPETGLSMPLTEEQMYMDHPYNTYTNLGLPPGPIANPGRNSLDAALDPDPDSTKIFYYVYNPQANAHIFARYLWEHEQNIAYVNSLG